MRDFSSGTPDESTRASPAVVLLLVAAIGGVVFVAAFPNDAPQESAGPAEVEGDAADAPGSVGDTDVAPDPAVGDDPSAVTSEPAGSSVTSVAESPGTPEPPVLLNVTEGTPDATAEEEGDESSATGGDAATPTETAPLPKDEASVDESPPTEGDVATPTEPVPEPTDETSVDESPPAESAAPPEPAPEPVDEAPAEEVPEAEDAFVTEWSYARQSSGNGNTESVAATFSGTRSGDAWATACAGTVEWTPYDGEPETRELAPAVAPPGEVPRGPIDVAAGDDVVLADWFVWDGCELLADAHHVTVVGLEERTFRIGGADVAVAAWHAEVPAGPHGGGDFWWDSATGLLLEASHGGLSGSATTLLTRTDESLAYR